MTFEGDTKDLKWVSVSVGDARPRVKFNLEGANELEILTEARRRACGYFDVDPNKAVFEFQYAQPAMWQPAKTCYYLEVIVVKVGVEKDK